MLRKWRIIFLKLSLVFHFANDLILQAQTDLEKALENKGKGIQSQLIETATARLKVGNERKQKFEEDLSKLERNKLKSSK